jgi:hypothetical protein
MRVATLLLVVLEALVVLGILGYGEIRHEYNPEEIAHVPASVHWGVVILLALLGLSVVWVVFRLDRN